MKCFLVTSKRQKHIKYIDEFIKDIVNQMNNVVTTHYLAKAMTFLFIQLNLGKENLLIIQNYILMPVKKEIEKNSDLTKEDMNY